MNAPEFPPAARRARRLEDLPFDNSFARLPARFYTRLEPVGLPDPYPVATSAGAAALIGLDPAAIETPDGVDYLSGNRSLPAGDCLAAVYSGHQFGVWAGRLGDGRAHLLGEVSTPEGPWELQLKGAGRTPYSRMADGRAVLRSSIREFLCSEAMAALGVPTTRALALVASDLPVAREQMESAAVLTRMAPSFIRFGSFEHWAAAGDRDALATLADYVIDRFYPTARESRDPVEAMLREVGRRTGESIARWQAVGFMHGVMNTDNMSILGLTIDYGPFGFMEAFDAGHICNHSDPGGRYRYAAQPHVGLWNLRALAGALLPLIGDRDAAIAAVDESYPTAYNDAFAGLMGAKLGLESHSAGDEALLESLFELLQTDRCDYTLFFRRLGALAADPADANGADDRLRALFRERDACDAWVYRWRERLARERRADAERRAAMDAVNPKYVLRNWIAESVIRKALERDYGELREVMACLARPFDEQPESERFAAPPPDWAACLTVSCSS